MEGRRATPGLPTQEAAPSWAPASESGGSEPEPWLNTGSSSLGSRRECAGRGVASELMGPAHTTPLVSLLSPWDPSAIQGRGALVWGASPPEYGDQGGLNVSGRLLGLKGAEPQNKVLRQ